jgi:hypothetical protein
MPAVDDFKCVALWSNYQWFIPARPLDVANQLSEIALAHAVRIVRVVHELLDGYPQYSILGP